MRYTNRLLLLLLLLLLRTPTDRLGLFAVALNAQRQLMSRKTAQHMYQSIRAKKNDQELLEVTEKEKQELEQDQRRPPYAAVHFAESPKSTSLQLQFPIAL